MSLLQNFIARILRAANTGWASQFANLVVPSGVTKMDKVILATFIDDPVYGHYSGSCLYAIKLNGNTIQSGQITSQNKVLQAHVLQMTYQGSNGYPVPVGGTITATITFPSFTHVAAYTVDIILASFTEDGKKGAASHFCGKTTWLNNQSVVLTLPAVTIPAGMDHIDQWYVHLESGITMSSAQSLTYAVKKNGNTMLSGSMALANSPTELTKSPTGFAVSPGDTITATITLPAYTHPDSYIYGQSIYWLD